MIVTKSWLCEWIDIRDISTADLLLKLNSIGLEVESSRIYDVPKKIVFGRVLECEKHPDAAKLSVCQVDIGTSVRQIVCGASNVRVGLTVAVATLGAVMPSGLVIKPVVLRGVESDGMLCSASEIGIDQFSDGILEIDASIGAFKLGDEICSNPIFNDSIIEIELTANRGDCLSVRGIARDLSAAFDRPLIDRTVKESEVKRVGIGRILALAHESDHGVNLKYKAFDIKELELPMLILLRLKQLGETNDAQLASLISYVTHSTGVVLKAYDYRFLNSSDAQLAKISLREDVNGCVSIMTDGTLKASVIGISQAKESLPTNDSTTVLLEASYIPPDVISKKMQGKKISGDSVYYRTSRGSEPELNFGISLCVSLLEKYSASSVYGGVIELENKKDEQIVSISKHEIDSIIGESIDKAKITKILKNLGFNVTKPSTDSFNITVPRFRHDIVNKQDIVEEIVRLVGIDNITAKPFVLTEQNGITDDFVLYSKRRHYRQKSAFSGFFESIHFVFEEKKTLQQYGFETVDDSKELLNPIVNTLDTLRTTLLISLLRSASNNAKNGYDSIRLFEIGSVFDKNRDESLKMAFIFSGSKESDTIQNSGKPQAVDFGLFVQKISDIVGSLTLNTHSVSHSLAHPYQSASVTVEGVLIGELFRVHPDIEKEFDLGISYMCEIDFEKLPYELKKAQMSSKYQASFRDLSVIVPSTISYHQIHELIKETNLANLIRFYPVDKYVDASLGANSSLTIRFVFQSFETTLQEQDIQVAIDLLLQELQTKLGIGLR